MASYADMAAKGPKQSPEEVSAVHRAPALPEVQHTDSSTSSLIDVDTPHISSVPSDYSSQPIQTSTQAEREAREQHIHAEAKKLQDKAAAAKSRARKNASNPVVLGNAVGAALVAGVLGVGAWRKYVRGELTGRVVVAWAGVVGLLGVGEYYVSRYLFKRYPPKN